MKRFMEWLGLWLQARAHTQQLKRVPESDWAAGITDAGELLLLHLPTLEERRVPIVGALMVLQRIGAVPKEVVGE